MINYSLQCAIERALCAYKGPHGGPHAKKIAEFVAQYPDVAALRKEGSAIKSAATDIVKAEPNVSKAQWTKLKNSLSM